MAKDEENTPGAGEAGEDDGSLKKRWATLLLLGLNVSVFVAMVLAGASPLYADWAAVAAGGVEPSRVWDGEVWRFLTACFIHLGIWHLALNAWVLWQLGPVLEGFIGGSRTLLIYLVTGVFGFALSIALRAVPSAGASGAVFGITGALIALALMLRNDSRGAHGQLGRMLLGALLPFVVATLVLGFLVPLIDNTAHVGGLLFGLVIGYGLASGDPQLFEGSATSTGISHGSSHAKWRGAAALVVGAILFIVVVAYGARPVLSPQYHAVAGLHALRARGPGPSGLQQAKAHASEAARLASDDAATFVLLGRIRSESATAGGAAGGAAAAGGATEADRAEGARLVREGLKRVDVKVDANDPEDVEQWASKAMFTLVRDLALGGGTQELPFADLRTVDALCDAALAEHEVRAPGRPAAELKNACAWLRLKAPDPQVRDPAGALALARVAVRDSREENASIMHTLAEALAQNGQPAEGLVWLERIAASGKHDELPGGKDFLDSERRRLKRLAEPVPARH